VPGVPPFANHLPVRIRFGDTAALQLGEVVAAHRAQRAIVILDEGLEERSRQLALALRDLEEVAIAVRHVKPAGEPDNEAVDAAAEAIRQARAEVVVAIGGGSVIDTAKAARLCAQLETPFSSWLAGERFFPTPSIPLVALPTTAGTGSEVSGGAVITDRRSSHKAGIAHPTLRPDDALVDPTLTLTVPPAMTAYTGIDALAQAIAGMVATTRTPVGDALALEALRLGGRSLVAAFRDGSNTAARSEMACASLLAGLTMNVSDCAAEHSLAQAIGGRFQVAHGLTVGLVLAETLDRERKHVPGQLERLADALGVPNDGTSSGARAVAGVRRLLRDLDFPVLRSLGVSTADLDDLTDLAVGDFFLTRSPHQWSRAEVREVFASALALSKR
jgi:alcohol dehydrogenase